MRHSSPQFHFLDHHHPVEFSLQLILRISRLQLKDLFLFCISTRDTVAYLLNQMLQERIPEVKACRASPVRFLFCTAFATASLQELNFGDAVPSRATLDLIMAAI